MARIVAPNLSTLLTRNKYRIGAFVPELFNAASGDVAICRSAPWSLLSVFWTPQTFVTCSGFLVHRGAPFVPFCFPGKTVFDAIKDGMPSSGNSLKSFYRVCFQRSQFAKLSPFRISSISHRRSYKKNESSQSTTERLLTLYFV